MAALGAGLLLATFVWTGLLVSPSQSENCKSGVPGNTPQANDIIYSPQTEFRVNGPLCIAWKPSEFFATENAARAKVSEAQKLAISRVDAAQARRDALKPDSEKSADQDAYRVELAKRDKELADAKTLRDTADEALEDLPEEKILSVFIDDKEIPVSFVARVQTTDKWQFKPLVLRTSTDAKDTDAQAWRALLGGLTRDGARKVKLSLGETGAKLPREGADLPDRTLRIFHRGLLLFGAIGVLLLLGGVFWAGAPGGMLRVRPPTANDDRSPPFSLGRAQMAFWFALTLPCFIWIWLISGQSYSVMTVEIVALLGISAATGLAAVAIDAPQAVSAKIAAGVASSEIATAEAGVAANPQTATDQEVKSAKEAFASTQSEGFFTDILSDVSGIVLHRVVMVTWTVLLGLMFVWSVFWNLSFPKFDQALLLLAGVVSGAYLGFKFPEKPTPPT